MKKPRLTLIPGGKAEKSFSINGTMVSMVDQSVSSQPGSVQVFEEDTHLVLTREPELSIPEEQPHPIRVMTEIMDIGPRTPGTIHLEGQNWYAVVLDLDREEPCQERWVREAAETVFRLAAQKNLSSLLMPLLGSVHGSLSGDTSLRIILSALDKSECASLELLQISTSTKLI